MLSTCYLLVLAHALYSTMVFAQCSTPGYIPCLPQGSNTGGVASSDFGDSGFWDSLQGVALDPIQRKAKRNAISNSPDLNERSTLGDNQLTARQNALCCAPDPDKYCLLLSDGNIPFCYDSTTTRFVFSDESFGFINNGSYYAADGTIINFQDGTESMTDGATASFAPATSTAPPMSATATVPGTGKVTGIASKGNSGGSSGSGSSTGSAASSSPSVAGTSPSLSSGSQPKSNEGSGVSLARAMYALIALAAGVVVFAVL